MIITRRSIQGSFSRFLIFNATTVERCQWKNKFIKWISYKSLRRIASSKVGGGPRTRFGIILNHGGGGYGYEAIPPLLCTALLVTVAAAVVAFVGCSPKSLLLGLFVGRCTHGRRWYMMLVVVDESKWVEVCLLGR